MPCLCTIVRMKLIVLCQHSTIMKLQLDNKLYSSIFFRPSRSWMFRCCVGKVLLSFAEIKNSYRQLEVCPLLVNSPFFCSFVANNKKRSIRALDKKNKERNSYLVHETEKKVFFSNTHGFAEVPLDTIFNVVFFNGSFRTVLCGGLKTGRSKKKS